MAKFIFKLPSENDIRNSTNGRIALHIINNDYDYDEKYMLVAGEQNSGIEEVAIFRMIKLLHNQKKVLFLSHSKMLNTVVKSVLESQKLNGDLCVDLIGNWTNLHKSPVLTFLIENNFCEYELLLFAPNISSVGFLYLKSIFDRITIFDSNYQQEQLNETNIRNLIEPFNEFNLRFNYKNTYQIYNFARYFVPNNPITNDKDTLEAVKKFNNFGDFPKVLKFNSIFELIERLRNITNDNYRGQNILILVPQRNDSQVIYTLLTSYNFECSILGEEGDFTDLKSILITSIDFQKWLPTFDIVLIVDFQAIEDNEQNRKLIWEKIILCKNSLIISFIGEFPKMLNDFPSETYSDSNLF